MSTANTFDVHFILRINKEKNGIAPIYVRISVNGARIEMSLKKKIKISDWHPSRGMAKNTNASQLKMQSSVFLAMFNFQYIMVKH